MIKVKSFIKHKLFDLCLKTYKLRSFYKQKLLEEDAFLVASGSWFHNRVAVHEKEPKNIAVFDLGTVQEPFKVDLNVRL